MYPSASTIIQTVARRTGVAVEAILGRSRKREIVEARHIAAWLIVRSGRTLMETARALRRLDHTTIMHARDKVAGRMETDRAYRAYVARIEIALGPSWALIDERSGLYRLTAQAA